MKRKLILVQILVVALILAGCGAATPAAVSVVDDAGKPVNLSSAPQRVVSLAPSITEILFALDLGDRIVGVTGDCDYPPEAKAKPNVGRYYSTGLEAIVAQKPDLVLMDGYDPVSEGLANVGLTTLTLQPKDLDGIYRNILLVGQVMRQDQKAEALVASLRKRVEKVTSLASGAATKPTVFFEVDATDPSQPWTAGTGSFIDQLIVMAGGANAVQASGDWMQYSLEQLVAADPDVYVLGGHFAGEPDQLGQRGGVWQGLKAVKLGHVGVMSDPSLISRPGPRVVLGLEELAKIIHPELFK